MDPWQAIADPTRRRILVLLSRRDLTAGELAEQFTSTRSAVSQHLGVLRAAGMVSTTTDGRRRIYHLQREALRQVRHDIEAFWTAELDELTRDATARSEHRRTDDEHRAAS